jgi:hypothetical protein
MTGQGRHNKFCKPIIKFGNGESGKIEVLDFEGYNIQTERRNARILRLLSTFLKELFSLKNVF